MPLMNRAGYVLHRGDALDAYPAWPAPDVIISDGARGIRGFRGDPAGTAGLPGWYLPHAEAWSRRAGPAATLWFWNTSAGWAAVHPLLAAAGWDYVQLITWDKDHGTGGARAARRVPAATEVCAFYQRRLEIPCPGGPVSAQQWLRSEWQRAGLPLAQANQACGVRDAATRKYLTQDWLWYWPPGEMVARLAAYACLHGDPAGQPYYCLGGQAPVTAAAWEALRHPWRHAHGITNVWRAEPPDGAERGQDIPGARHRGRIPLEFMRRILRAVTGPGSVVWEPFAGLAPASAAALELGRFPCAAETDPRAADLASRRLALSSPAGRPACA